jgi:hypothetical protein
MEWALLGAVKRSNYYKNMKKGIILEANRKCATGVLFYSLFMNNSV